MSGLAQALGNTRIWGLSLDRLPDLDYARLRFGAFYFAAGMAPISALCLTIFGLWTLPIGTLLMVAPAIILSIALGITHPAFGKLAFKGFCLGLVAVSLYDCFRYSCVLAGMMGDFIPNIGGWLTGRGQPDWVLGYLWRYIGNGGGMGMAFLTLYSFVVPVSERRESSLNAEWFSSLRMGILFGVSIWFCLMVTLLVSPQGQLMMFKLTQTSFWVSLIGHVIFGAVLGGFAPVLTQKKKA